MNSLCGLVTLGERGARPFFCLKKKHQMQSFDPKLKVGKVPDGVVQHCSKLGARVLGFGPELKHSIIEEVPSKKPEQPQSFDELWVKLDSGHPTISARSQIQSLYTMAAAAEKN